MQQGIDSRAMFATFVTKLPRLFVLAVAGAIVGSGLNLFVVLVKTQDICYVSETKYYIDFADGRYEARDYYNDFTWNEVLETQILGRVMELLGSAYDRNQVSAMLSARILSDVRYLTVYVKGQDLAQVEAVKNTLKTVLEEFGTGKDEFDAIGQIGDLEIVQEEIPYFGWRAAMLGAVIAAGIGIFVIAFRFSIGSTFYTKSDITARLGIPVCGMTFREGRSGDGALEQRQAEMLKENMSLLREKYGRILLMDASDGQAASAFQQELFDRGLADASFAQLYGTEKNNRCMGKRNENGSIAVVAVIPFGKPCREKITDEIEHAKLHDCGIVAAVLTQSDRKWMRIYYAWRKERTGRM